jgi:CRISPR/Cas system-associated endoribonuclease Cas2
MSDWTLTQAEYRQMKSRLTKVRNKKDPVAIERECDKTLVRFSEVGYPDDWRRWESAKEDAQLQIRLAKKW